ncbi:hypothetical protein KY289_018365 [Solanum tuberosum]|nr:hypothetical protein KY289_018365 [Solanum tuberosum]
MEKQRGTQYTAPLCCLFHVSFPRTVAAAKASCASVLGLWDRSTSHPRTSDSIPSVRLPFLFRNGANFQRKCCLPLMSHYAAHKKVMPPPL